VVALDRDDREELEQRHEYLTGLGLELELLTGIEARRREPHLARAVNGAIYSPLDHQVDNRKVFEALKTAYLAAGGRLCEGAEVTAIVTAAGRATGVMVGAAEIAEEIAAEAVVLAAGAWSRNIAGLPDAVRPPVRPLKGQMLALQMPLGAALIDHVVWGPRTIYMVPRNDGRLVIGTTVEEMGFDTELTAGGMFHILRYAYEILPGIYDLPLVESWAGLRPTSRDDAPILGPSALDGLVIATGHHRNGILLAPMTAELIGRYLLNGEIMDAMKPFLPNRFAAARAAPEPQAAEL
jgi:glycine oxidase